MEAVLTALIYKYAKQHTATANITPEQLADYLWEVQYPTEKHPSEKQGSISLLNTLYQSHPDWILSPEIIGLIGSVDDCSKLINKLAALHADLEPLFQAILPRIAYHLILDLSLTVRDEASILTVLDHLVETLIGWTPDLGAAGDKVKQRLCDILEKVSQGEGRLAQIQDELIEFTRQENQRIHRLEARLIASETGLLQAQQSRTMAIKMINTAMAGKNLTPQIIAFLQGPWNASAQLIALNDGPNSDRWHRAVKLTQTLIWTYQTIDTLEDKEGKETQRLYRIIEHLPTELKLLLVSLAHDDEATESALRTIESDHIDIISQQPLDYVDFEPLAGSHENLSGSDISKMLLRRVDRLVPGQWFALHEAETSSRVKLVLKMDDIKQLVFTNRNGIKVLQKSFSDFAYLLSTHIAKPLNPSAVYSSTFKTFYEGVCREYDRHQIIIDQRRDQIDLLDKDRITQRRKSTILKQSAAIDLLAAGLKEAEEIASLAENQDQKIAFTIEVGKLKTGALMKLPTQVGDVEDCKLAVKISAIDKLIFVNAKGIKVGEYSSEQLVALLVAEQASIIHLGVGFEDTLEQVVTKLRLDRKKSYDDLTGK